MAKNEIINPGWKRFEKMTVSPAVRRGNMLFISGTGATDDQGDVMHKADIVAQTREIYKKFETILKAVGATFDNIVMTVEYITTTENYKGTANVRREYFKNGFPASTGVVVRNLVKKDALIEIEAIAILD